MKNKLLLTSALVGVLASGAALAETKISGGMVLGYKAMTNTTAAGSTDGAGRETQLNISKTGDLNNGLKYATGFSLEFDGSETNVTRASRENIYFNAISGDSTVSFGFDHAPNVSQSAAPRVAESADTAFAGGTVTTNNLYAYEPGGSIKQHFSITGIQNVIGGKLSLSYVPSNGDTGGNDSGTGSTNATAGNRAYNIIYNGNAGVDGLRLVLAYQKEDMLASQTDVKVKQYGIGYNFGQFAAGIQVNDENSSANIDKKSIELGATVALSKNVSAGVIYIETDSDNTAKDEVITVAQLGYNMGPATVAFSYGVMENALGSATVRDVDVASVRLSLGF